MTHITFDEAVSTIRVEADEVRNDALWGTSRVYIDTMTDVMIAFLLDDDTFLDRFGIPSIHAAMNAYHYYSASSAQLPSSVIDRVIGGCHRYMQHGWDDADNLIETAKVLAVFTFVRDNLGTRD